MKTQRTIDIEGLGMHRIRVIETRELHVTEGDGGIWVYGSLQCTAIVVTSGSKSLAFDIHGREIPPPQIPAG